jgi:mono/diheme cytochrome c family protein
MSTTPTPAPTRYTLRDLPLPARLVLTTFLISVGLGYLWAMAQIHFKHASGGNPMPTAADLVARFSGVPWPLESKPADESEKKDKVTDATATGGGVVVPAVKIKTLVNARCAVCHQPGGEKDEFPLNSYEGIEKYLQKTTEHPKGQFHAVVTGTRKSWNKKNMVKAFFEKSEGWEDLTPEQRKAEEPKREVEHRLMVAWAEAGAPRVAYESDKFQLPADIKIDDLPENLRTTAPGVTTPPAANGEKKAVDKWAEAKRRRLSVDALTQSTHAHLLTFSLLWAATGLIFAFTRYSYFVRCVLAPVVLVAQVADVGCWWLARLEPPAGPYFALAIMGTGAVVGLGLVGQILLSLWDMYRARGRAVLVLLFLVAAGLFGVAYVKVIEPQLQAERALVADESK